MAPADALVRTTLPTAREHGTAAVRQTEPMAPTDDTAPDSIALVATDLDGTLLNSDEIISPRTLDAIHELLASDVHLLLVTGRPPRWLPTVLDQIGVPLTCICANGAIAIDAATHEILFQTGISGVVALHAAEVLREVVPEVGFAIERAPLPADLWSHTAAFAHDHDYHPRWPTMEGTPVAALHELIDDGLVLKLLARSELRLGQERVDEIVEAARSALGQRVEVTHSERDRLLLEISAPGVDKGSALARLAGEWGIPAERVVAVGDMMNDLPMLEWAGHPYAVANAHPQLRAMARPLPSHDDEGLAVLLEGVNRNSLP
jgi:Cof subfamily protein (haloacid dehalogenase superfamily)